MSETADPIRTARILPEFGGVLATSQTASCGSCHMSEAAGKAGTLLNFAVGGQGRGCTDASGSFIPRRRPRPELQRLRQSPRFPSDALVDELPTLTVIYEFAVGSPARGRKLPLPGRLLRTGRLDALDSVARNSPSVIGAAFNNRLLLGGFAGEPASSPGGLNPGPQASPREWFGRMGQGLLDYWCRGDAGKLFRRVSKNGKAWGVRVNGKGSLTSGPR